MGRKRTLTSNRKYTVARRSETSEAREKRLKQDAARKSASRASESTEARQRRLKQDAARKAACRASESTQSRKRRLKQEAAHKSASRASESTESRHQRLHRNAQRNAVRRATESSESRQYRLSQGAKREARRRATRSEEARQQRLTTGICCSSGNCTLQPLPALPHHLDGLIHGTDVNSNHFLKALRTYNSCFTMTSLDCTQSRQESWNPSSRIQVQVHHKIGSSLRHEGMGTSASKINKDRCFCSKHFIPGRPSEEYPDPAAALLINDSNLNTSTRGRSNMRRLSEDVHSKNNMRTPLEPEVEIQDAEQPCRPHTSSVGQRNVEKFIIKSEPVEEDDEAPEVVTFGENWLGYQIKEEKSDNSSDITSAVNENVDTRNSNGNQQETNNEHDSSSSVTLMLLQKILQNQEEIKETQRHHSSLINGLTEKTDLQTLSQINLPEGVNFPLNSLDEAEELERRLTDPFIFNSVVSVMADIGSNSVNLNDATKRILQFALSNDFAMQYNFTGEDGKRQFSSTHLCDAVYKSLMRNPITRYSDYHEIEKHLAKWLCGNQDSTRSHAQCQDDAELL